MEDRIAHTMASVNPVMEHREEWKEYINQCLQLHRTKSHDCQVRVRGAP